MDKNRASAIVLVLLILGNPRFSYGDDNARIRELEKKVEELTRTVNEMRGQMQTTAPTNPPSQKRSTRRSTKKKRPLPPIDPARVRPRAVRLFAI